MPRTVRIEIEQDVLTVSVPVSGQVLEVVVPGHNADNIISWMARRPGWTHATQGVDGFLAACTEPRSSLTEIRELSERDRRRVMLAVVRSRGCESDWRRLHGTSLTADERFFSVMHWARQREATRAQQRLRELRQQLIDKGSVDFARIGAGSIKGSLDRISAGWKVPLAEIAGQFVSRHGPLIDKVGRQVGAPGELTGIGLAGRLSPRVQQALGVRPGLGGALAFKAEGHEQAQAAIRRTFGASSLDAGALGIAGILSGDKGLSEFRAIATARSRLAGAGLFDPAEFGVLGAVKRFRDLHHRPWLSDAAEMVCRQALHPSVLEGLPTISGLPWKQFSNLAGLPLADGRIQLLLEKQGVSRLFVGLGRGPEGSTLNWHSGAFGEIRRVGTELAAAARLGKKWKGDPLWYLLSLLTPHQSQLLVVLERETVYETMFAALEMVVTRSDFLNGVQAAITEVSFLTPPQRKWLLHGLDHAAEGDWDQAIPPLFAGFEGALHGSAIQAEAIEPDSGKLVGAEGIIKRIDFSEDFQAFAVRLAFADRGQPFRHGRPKHEAREQALILLVAVIGWLDHALDSEASYQLARAMQVPLKSVSAPRHERNELVIAV